MRNRIRGPLSSLIDRHLKLRKSLGFHDQSTRGALYQFDRYLKNTFPSVRTVSRSMVIGYLETIPHLHPRTRNNRLLAIRQLCRFIFQSNRVFSAKLREQVYLA